MKDACVRMLAWFVWLRHQYGQRHYVCRWSGRPCANTCFVVSAAWISVILCRKYSSCEWALLKRISRWKVRGQGHDQTNGPINGGGMHFDGMTSMLTCYAEALCFEARPSSRSSVRPITPISRDVMSVGGFQWNATNVHHLNAHRWKGFQGQRSWSSLIITSSYSLEGAISCVQMCECCNGRGMYIGLDWARFNVPLDKF